MVAENGLSNIMGRENVVYGDDVPGHYSGDMSFTAQVRPRAVVKPTTLEQVQAIVKWANETGTNLIPLSSGPPHFRGDTIPASEGAVVVDLTLMKKILRVDRRNRVCMVEPGVTFGELIPALGKEDLAPLLTLAPRASKSVLASWLEREPMTIPRFHWEAQDPLYCVEVIYGNGDMFRTGSAFGPGTLEEQWAAGRAQVRGMGPSQVDFTRLLQGAQGTLGIVTWGTMKCQPLPKVRETFLIPSDDLEKLTDLCRRLLWKKLGEEMFVVNNLTLASLLFKDAVRIKAATAGLPHWILVYSISGAGMLPQDKLDYQRDDSMEEAGKFYLRLEKSLKDIKAEDVEKALLTPCAEPYWKLRYKGNCADILFLTTLDKAPGFVKQVNGLAGKYGYPAADIGVYIQPLAQGANCHVEFNLMFNPADSSKVERVKRLDAEGAAELYKEGAFFSRPYGPWAKFAFGEEQTIRALQRVKQIFDPKGVMNPGKLCY